MALPTELDPNRINILMETNAIELDIKATWRTFNKLIEEHNEQQPYAERAKRIRMGLLLTAKCIISDFITAWKKGNVSDGFYETSTALIARSTKQSVDSVKRHLKKLTNMGFILARGAGEHWHNYTLKVNKIFLVFKQAVNALFDKETQQQEKLQQEPCKIEPKADLNERDTESLTEQMNDTPLFWQKYLQNLFRGRFFKAENPPRPS
jgi:DNA-binding transcriptional ArsR family regulator